MSLSQKNLSSIQKAGQAVRDASEAIAAAVRTQAEGMVASLASQPFGVETDQGIARFKTLSQLSQGLATVESRLQELYAVATELANPASDVIALPSSYKRRAASNAAAVDVVAKPAKAAKKAKPAARKAAALTANDNKLLAFLQGALKAGGTLSITGHEMAEGSKLPLGSVGLSLSKIMAAGAVKRVGRGSYQLGTVAGATAEATNKSTVAKKAQPAKKAKPAAAKKAKAAPAPATEAPAAEAAAAPL